MNAAGPEMAWAMGERHSAFPPLAPAAGPDWADAPPGLIDGWVAGARVLHVARGALVISPGEGGDEVFLVLDGHVRVTLFPPNGREVLIRDLPAGRMFGEMAALDRAPRSAAVVAVAASRVAAVRGAVFREALAADTAAALWVARHLARQLRVATDRLFEFATLNTRSRLHSHLLRLSAEAGVTGDRAVIAPAPTHELLASAIGSQRETVTRELGALAAEGLVRRVGAALEVPSVSALAQALSGEADKA